jgi:hypothetical protein
LRLLARFWLTATLLLAGLLARILGLLTGILARLLVGVVHSGSPLLNLTYDNLGRGGWLPREHWFPEGFNVTAACRDRGKGTPQKTTLYKPFG